MADAKARLPENVTGRFFVNATCIDCDLCREKAPGNFAHNDAARRSYVHRQPSDESEEAACDAALKRVPGGGHRRHRLNCAVQVRADYTAPRHL